MQSTVAEHTGKQDISFIQRYAARPLAEQIGISAEPAR